jgi:hypothetical protein
MGPKPFSVFLSCNHPTNQPNHPKTTEGIVLSTVATANNNATDLLYTVCQKVLMNQSTVDKSEDELKG